MKIIRGGCWTIFILWTGYLLVVTGSYAWKHPDLTERQIIIQYGAEFGVLLLIWIALIVLGIARRKKKSRQLLDKSWGEFFDAGW